MIPLFKNTEEALAFGQKHKGQKGMIRLLNLERERLIKKVNEYITKGENAKGLYLASGQVQFIREALEVSNAS